MPFRFALAVQSEHILIKDWEVDIGHGFRKCAAVPWNFPSSKGGIGATDYTGYGLYRATVVIPDHLKSHQLSLFFYSIDDADETYLNGKKIGATGAFPKSGKSDDGY
ncbi:MAG TPA: hypothetical protein VF857_08980, partial [Spirochaetota bacterium]